MCATMWSSVVVVFTVCRQRVTLSVNHTVDACAVTRSESANIHTHSGCLKTVQHNCTKCQPHSAADQEHLSSQRVTLSVNHTVDACAASRSESALIYAAAVCVRIQQVSCSTRCPHSMQGHVPCSTSAQTCLGFSCLLPRR